jgi:hypothetical protein
MAPELTVESRPEGGAYLAKGPAGLTSKLSRLPTNAGSDSQACSWLVKLNRVTWIASMAGPGKTSFTVSGRQGAKCNHFSKYFTWEDRSRR